LIAILQREIPDPHQHPFMAGNYFARTRALPFGEPIAVLS
jgi:hypothetical protein